MSIISVSQGLMEASMVKLYVVLSALTLFHSITETVGNDDFNIVAIGRNAMSGQKLLSEVLSQDGVCRSAPLPPLPVGVTDSASVFFQDQLVICGGMTYGYVTSWCHGLESNAAYSGWKTLPSLNIARSYFTLTKAGDSIYAVGGWGYGYDELDSVEKNSGEGWELIKAKMPRYQYGHSTVHFKTTNSLVVFGDGGKVDSLDLSTLEWSSLPQLPVHDLKKFGCAVVEEAGEEKILVSGGWKPWPQDRRPGACYGWEVADGEFISQVYSYNGATWTEAGQLTSPRAFHTMAVLDGRPIVLGGDHGDFEDCKIVHDVSVERMGEGGVWEKLPATANLKQVINGHATPSIYTVAAVPADKFPCLD